MKNALFDFLESYMPLEEDEKQAILDLDIFRSYPKGTVLLREGEKSDKGYFVLRGCLRTYYLIDGEEKTTTFYTEMEGLTPPCMTSGEPSDYFVACVEDCFLLVADSSMEAPLFEKFPRFEKLCRILSEDLLAKKQLDLDRFKTSSPEERYLSLLDSRPDLIQRVPQHQLASFLGITPQSLSRLRARLAEKRA